MINIKKITVSMPEHLHDFLKIYAKRKYKSMNSFILDWIESKYQNAGKLEKSEIDLIKKRIKRKTTTTTKK